MDQGQPAPPAQPATTAAPVLPVPLPPPPALLAAPPALHWPRMFTCHPELRRSQLWSDGHQTVQQGYLPSRSEVQWRS